MRYGDNVKAWWIDGSYKNALGYTEELHKLYYDAAKKSNPHCAVAFNEGVFTQLVKCYSGEDFTAGESNDFIIIPEEKYLDGALCHTLAPLGYNTKGNHWYDWCGWGKSGLKHTKEYLRDYIRHFNTVGGIVSVDILVNIDGSFDPEQEAVLRWVGNNL